MNATELREMSDEQLQLTLDETCGNLFRLRIQSQTERLDAPSELRRRIGRGSFFSIRRSGTHCQP